MRNNRMLLCDLPKLKTVILEEQCFAFMGRVVLQSETGLRTPFVDVPTLENQISYHESSFRSVFFLDEQRASGFGSIIRRQSPYIKDTKGSNSASEMIEMSPSVKSFRMSEGSYNLVKELSFDGCTELQEITIHPNSFISCHLVRICGLPKLKTITICSNCFSTLYGDYDRRKYLFSDSEGEESEVEDEMDEEDNEEDFEEDDSYPGPDEQNEEEEAYDRDADSDEMNDWEYDDDYSDEYDDEMDEEDDFKDDDLIQEKDLVQKEDGVLVISNCPVLETITVQDYCFCRYSSVTISRGLPVVLQL